MSNLNNIYTANPSTEIKQDDLAYLGESQGGGNFSDAAIRGVDIGMGWIGVSGSWSYASATTITVPSGATSVYQKGDRIRLKQGGGYKYFYVTAVASTTLTVSGGTDYTVANAAITDAAYSRASLPFGFPSFFSYTPTWSGLTVGSGTVDARYTYNGGWVDMVISVTFNSTSITGAVSITNMPVSIHSSHVANSPLGTAVYVDTGVNYYSGLVYRVDATSVILRALSASSSYVQATNLSSTVPFTWGNTDALTAVVRYKAA